MRNSVCMRDEALPYEAWVVVKREDRWGNKWEKVVDYSIGEGGQVGEGC